MDALPTNEHRRCLLARCRPLADHRSGRTNTGDSDRRHSRRPFLQARVWNCSPTARAGGAMAYIEADDLLPRAGCSGLGIRATNGVRGQSYIVGCLGHQVVRASREGFEDRRSRSDIVKASVWYISHVDHRDARALRSSRRLIAVARGVVGRAPPAALSRAAPDRNEDQRACKRDALLLASGQLAWTPSYRARKGV